MILALLVILIVMWLIGVGTHLMGDLIHLLLIVIVALAVAEVINRFATRRP